MNFTKLSGKRLPIIFLIVVPAIYFFFTYFIFPILVTFLINTIPHENLNDIISFTNLMNLIWKLILFIVSIIILVGYGLYPYTFSAKKYFEILGNSKVVEEYEFLKKLICVLLPVAIIVTIIIITISNFVTEETLNFNLDNEDLLQLGLNKTILDLFPSKPLVIEGRSYGNYTYLTPEDQVKVIRELYRPRIEAVTNFTSFVPLVGPLVQGALDYYPPIKFYLDGILGSTQIAVFLVLYAALFRIFMHEARKEFSYYFAKALLEVSNKIHNEIDRIRYLAKGLNSYDKYLKKSLNLQIKNLKDIQEKIAVTDTEYRNILLQSIHEEKDDRFDIIKKLSEFLSVKNIEDLLEPENIKLRFVEVSPFVAAVIIPIVVAVIQFFAK